MVTTLRRPLLLRPVALAAGALALALLVGCAQPAPTPTAAPPPKPAPAAEAPKPTPPPPPPTATPLPPTPTAVPMPTATPPPPPTPTPAPSPTAVPKPAAQVATYVGSQSCKTCHAAIAGTWEKTVHALAIQDATKNPNAITADWSQPYENRTFQKSEVVLVHGVQWKQRYVDKDMRIMPAQWNFDDKKWGAYGDPKTWQNTNWVTSCASCHVVGYNPETKKWAELGVGCEACHGPASEHVKSPGTKGSIVNPKGLKPDAANSVCGQCHTRGKSADGKLDYPVGFKVGEVLSTQHFKIVGKDSKDAWWADGSVKQHRQQYPEWLDSKHAQVGVGCTSCHSVHETKAKYAVTKAGNQLCLDCHSKISTDPKTGHAPIAKAPEHKDCIACHMAAVGKSAKQGDERVHTFKVVRPKVTVELGGGDVAKQPNSCSTCHPKANQADLQKALEEGLKSVGKS